MPQLPAGPSQFEALVKRLRLTPETYASSTELRRWCERNRTRCYVPEWLLQEWGFGIDGSDVK
jgi:hypothetical protein